MINFTHLHVHSEYSLLDGSARIKDLVSKTKELGMNSVALTDHGSMYGIIQFYKECRKQGINPVLGSEIYVTDGDMEEKSPNNRKYYHLVLLAENNKGLENLMKIVSQGHIRGFYYRPRVDYEVLKKHSEGLIALSACLAGEVPEYLRRGDYQGAIEKAKFYEDIFGSGNFFLELQDHGMEEQKALNKELIKLSKDTGIDLVATNDLHYLEKSDNISHDVLLCIQTGKTINDENRMKFPSSQFYLKSPEEMMELFSYVPEAISNTQEIADRCRVDIEFHKTKLPHFEVPDNYTNEEYLRYLIEEGLEKKYKVISDEIKERYEFEFNTIKEMGYIDYFLIVWDFVRFAKDQGIPVGPGRGSAAGSIISYALEITGVDPLEFDLLFERFLNPERVSMPDIDIDFCYERREEVINYVVEKYGVEKVAQIVTFGTMAARGAIRDVGRALDVSYGKVDAVAKMVPSELNMTLSKALEISKDLRDIYEKDYEVKRLIDIALSVEGLPRHTSTHAAGVLITGTDVTDYVPLTRNDDIIATQYNMIELEELGLLKMDFLGLRTLTVIDDTIKLVKESKGIDIDISSIDLEDPKVLKLFHDAETIGIFQFESPGMRRFLKDLKADRFENLVAANSLFRPGPMDQIPQFVASKHDSSKIRFIHPKLETILDDTYGCIVYQEQVMQIFQEIGGYSLGRADLVRRAMSKKQMDVMEEERKNFIYGLEEDGQIIINGAIRNGVDEGAANKIYDLMITFANYAFNKSHSVAYALVAMQTAYLKTYYPSEYMAALISSVVSQTNQVVLYLEESKKMGINILRPDVNHSYKKFSVEGKDIRFGLQAIKGIGSQVIDALVGARKEGGEFTSLKDFISRVLDYKAHSLNKRSVEGLIRSGSLDGIIPSRAKAMAVYEGILSSHQQEQKRNIRGQVDLFGDFFAEDESQYDFEYPNVPEFSNKELYEMEKDSTGVYITGHPLEEYEEIIKKINKSTIGEIMHQDELESQIFADGEYIKIAGMVINAKTMLTRKNDLMAFVTIEDMIDSIECVVFPRVYESYRDILKEGKVLSVQGRLSVSDAEDTKILVDKFTPIEEEEKRYLSKKLFLRLNTKNEEEKFNCILEVLNEYKGDTPVVFYFAQEKESAMNQALKIDIDKIDKIKLSLKSYLNDEDIVVS